MPFALNDKFDTPLKRSPAGVIKAGDTGDILIGRLHPHAITAERPDDGDDAELVERLATIVRGAPLLMRVLLTIRALELPDWLIMSGAVYQRVLNALTERAPDYGVRDYDLGYFEPLRSAVEVRNQARVLAAATRRITASSAS